MAVNNQREAQPLFRSGSDGGTQFLFIAIPEGWAITRSGEVVAFGTGDRPSVDAGIKQFVSLTVPCAGAPACGPVVREQLDRIEAKSPVVGVPQRVKSKQDRAIPEVSAPFSLVRRRPVRGV